MTLCYKKIFVLERERDDSLIGDVVNPLVGCQALLNEIFITQLMKISLMFEKRYVKMFANDVRFGHNCNRSISWTIQIQAKLSSVVV